MYILTPAFFFPLLNLSYLYVPFLFKGPKLVPDVETTRGQEVHSLRQLLNEVPIGPITFGVLANRTLCTSEIRFPKRMAKMVNREYIGGSNAFIYKLIHSNVTKPWTRQN